MSLEINGHKYTGFWSTIASFFIASWVLIIVAIILLFVGLLLFSPLLIPILLGIIIGRAI